MRLGICCIYWAMGESLQWERKSKTQERIYPSRCILRWARQCALRLYRFQYLFSTPSNLHFEGMHGLVSMLQSPTLLIIVNIGAWVALLGVVLNLLLGLSRMLLAMSRRNDMPKVFDQLDAAQNPRNAIIGVAVFIGLLVLIGNLQTTWGISAFTVLVYYGICNLAALKLMPEQQMFPKWVVATGTCSMLDLWS